MNLGTCLCGDITWEVTGNPEQLVNCHCSICRKLHGSDFVTFVIYPAAAFRWRTGEDLVAWYTSSPGPAMRPFCPRCGSKVASLSPDGRQAFMPAGNLTGDIDRELDYHMFVDSRAPWHEITDGFPQFAGFPDGIDVPAVESTQRPPQTVGAIGGSCHCGRVRFEFDKPIERMGNCHCSLCRKSQSAALSSEVFVDEVDFRITSGSGHIRAFNLPGSHFDTHFCDLCASRVPHLLTSQSLYLVPTGALDQDPGIRPMAHIFVGSKASWFEITDNLPQFDEYPPVD